MDKFFIDYETFWGTKYSLRTQGMSYTDYILDERFQVHGASVAINRKKPRFLTCPELVDMFRDMINKRANLIHVSHNALFDAMITYLIMQAEFGGYFCTLAMIDAIYQGAIGRGLDECMKTLLGREGKSDIIKEIKDVRTEDITPEQWQKLTRYANEDLAATQDLFYNLSPSLPADEHEIMDTVIKMFVVPELEFDEKVLREAVAEADADRAARIAGALDLGATVEILKGNKTFPEFLKSKDIEVPLKPSPTVKDEYGVPLMIPALAKTDVGFQQMLEHDDKIIKALAVGRLAVKSTQATTRAYRFLKLHELIGCFPVAYNYARAHTWRVSGANKINPANLKRKSKLRTCIIAPDGYRLGVGDSGQIECRTGGYIAGQDSLLDMFRNDEDPYNDMASDIFGKAIDRTNNPEHKLKGFIGKTATLGLGFQMGGPKFKWTVETKAKVELGHDIDFPLDEAYRIVDLYRSKNWKIKDMWDHCTRFLHAMVSDEDVTWKYPDGVLEIKGNENKIYFPNGTWLYYPMLSYNDGDFTYLNKQGSRYITKYIYGGLCFENIIQKFARDVVSWQMIEINNLFKVVMHTYDENVALVKEETADSDTKIILNIMRTPPAWAKTLPLSAEGGHAKEYSK